MPPNQPALIHFYNLNHFNFFIKLIVNTLIIFSLYIISLPIFVIYMLTVDRFQMLRERNMKEKSIEKFFMLPFSVVCGSASSVAVSSQSGKTNTNPPDKTKSQEGEERSSSVKMKSFWRFLAMTRPTFSQKIQRLKRHFKGFSQLFVHKEEEVEMEIEIGYPTDVKHVTHIGWDGSTTINPIKGWENLKTPELISFPSISIKQFELAMAAQAGGPVDVNNNHCA